jgi:hypothetical protein
VQSLFTMMAMQLLSLQRWKIDLLLADLEREPDSGTRLLNIVEVVEELTAHLAVKKNVVYPAIDDAHASALVACWQGDLATRRGLLLLARATYHDELCAHRVRQLRRAIEAQATNDRVVLDAIEETLTTAAVQRVGREVERFHAACMHSRRDAVRAAGRVDDIAVAS